MRKHEFKDGLIIVQQIEDRTVKQIFAVMGNRDEGNDRIWPGAFTKTLQERADDVQVLWQHMGHEPPIGVPQLLKEIGRPELPPELIARYPDAQGALYGEIKYLDTPRGSEVLVGIREKAIRKNSIGYATIKADFETVDGEQIRNLRELALFDVSPVNWGMNRATTNLKAAMPYRDCGIASQDTEWSAPTLADFTDQVWGDLSDAEIRRISSHFAWSANAPAEAFGDLKLPHHQPGKSDVGKAVWAGVSAAMGALMGARGGVRIPDVDREDVYNHLAKHYAQFDKEPPSFKFVETCSYACEIAPMTDELKEGRMLSASNIDKMQSAMTAIGQALEVLQGMLDAAKPAEPPKGVDPRLLVLRLRAVEIAIPRI